MMLKFELSQEQAQKIVTALGHMPYAEVYQVVAIVQKQAAEQLAHHKEDDGVLVQPVA